MALLVKRSICYTGDTPPTTIHEEYKRDGLDPEMENFLVQFSEVANWTEGSPSNDDDHTEELVGSLLCPGVEDICETLDKIPWFDWMVLFHIQPYGTAWDDHGSDTIRMTVEKV